MTAAVFVQVKCELGHAYDVAREAVDTIEAISEVYSTSGKYDLLMKFYLPREAEVGRFINEHVQTLPHVQDTHTIITFNAFS